MAKKKDVNGFVPAPLVGAGQQCPDDQATASAWPQLHACLLPLYREGKCCRQAGSIRIRVVGAYWSITLSCPTEGVETEVMTETLSAAFQALEEVLADGRAVWKPDWNSVKKSRQAKV